MTECKMKMIDLAKEELEGISEYEKVKAMTTNSEAHQLLDKIINQEKTHVAMLLNFVLKSM